MAGVSIVNPVETNSDGMTVAAVALQDQTSGIVDLFLQQTLNTVTLDATTILDSETIDLVAGHNVVIGDTIYLSESGIFSQFIATNVVTNTITLDSPIDKVFTTAATALRTTTNMNVDGSVTSQTFNICPRDGQKWDITRVILVIEATSNSMDFTGFGPLAALTSGCVLRTKNGTRNNLFNWKTNGDFINRSFEAVFEQKTGGGGSGFTSRTVFAGQNERGVTVRLRADDSDELQVLVQDDLTGATLTVLRVIAQGHIVV